MTRRGGSVRIRTAVALRRRVIKIRCEWEFNMFTRSKRSLTAMTTTCSVARKEAFWIFLRSLVLGRRGRVSSARTRRILILLSSLARLMRICWSRLWGPLWTIWAMSRLLMGWAERFRPVHPIENPSNWNRWLFRFSRFRINSMRKLKMKNWPSSLLFKPSSDLPEPNTALKKYRPYSTTLPR